MPIDADTGWEEPDIIINGRPLLFAECMTLRVALATFILWLDEPAHRAGLGESLSQGYERHAAAIERTMQLKRR